jgi:hypothetical protein
MRDDRDNDRIHTLGRHNRMTASEEKATLWQGCANLCKSIATCYQNMSDEGNTKAKEYWRKAARYEEKVLAFVEREKLS